MSREKPSWLSRAWSGLREATRRYFVAGLLVFAPVGITIWAMAWIVQRLDNLLLPYVLQWLTGIDSPPRLPLLGALFTFVVIILVGVIARHFFGHEIVRVWERVLSRVPIAGSIYGGVKQLFEAIVAGPQQRGFNRVVLVEYPRKGAYAVAFTTGGAADVVSAARPGETLVNCFVPTTPNPTSGFYLLVPAEEVYEVEMTVEEGFKLIMSAGLVAPGNGTVPGDRPAVSVPASTIEDAARHGRTG
ncbi:MAG: DUF502 domain-containing protein [Proteobacteria bacterium]|nr:DUF502 domain-containing protein [Pseudomonadota bacterium]